MGFTTHLWKCKDCQKQVFYTSKQKHPSINHQCKYQKMTAEDYALELLEKFTTRRDAIIALDLLFTYALFMKSEKNYLDFLDETKTHLLKKRNYIQ